MSKKKSSFLIAMPNMNDPLFAKSVILMTHNSAEGALGYVLNVTTGASLSEAIKMVNLELLDPPEMPILLGGPVRTEFFWLIHSPEATFESTITITDQFAISGAMELLPLLGTDDFPEIYFAGVGYSGWDADQLETEIETGSWWLGDLDPHEIFPVSPEAKWHEAFKILGIETDEMVDTIDEDHPPLIN